MNTPEFFPPEADPLLFPIRLIPHGTHLDELYRHEAKRLKKAIAPLYMAGIHQIGSSAVPGIVTEPIVDILLEMPRFGSLDAYTNALAAAGYRVLRKNETRADLSRGYTENGFADKVYHLRLRYSGDNTELYLRDYLIEHPDEAKELEVRKIDLAERFPFDRNAYEAGKADFLQNTTTAALRLYAGRYRCSGCGGCAYPGVPYETQLRAKDARVRELLGSEHYTGIKPCPVLRNYRNKMEYTFGNETKDSPLTLGLHPKGSFISVVDTPDCSLVPEDFNRIVQGTLDFCKTHGYTFYHKKTHEGLLRNLVLRLGVRTGELLVNIVTADDGTVRFDEDDFLSMLDGLKTENRIAGVLHTINDQPSDKVTPERTRVLRGRAYYMEEILGLRFRVGAFSFFQTNVEAAERLYREALALIPDLSGKTVYDLFCGTGTITQAAARKAGEALGIEISEDAVASARENARLNGLSNCTFLCGDVGAVLSSVPVKPDVIIVDPPRAGISEETLRKILSYGVPEILYISCNPVTLAENIRQAKPEGYTPAVIRAYDNFPGTEHVESVVLLRKTTDGSLRMTDMVFDSRAEDKPACPESDRLSAPAAVR